MELLFDYGKSSNLYQIVLCCSVVGSYYREYFGGETDDYTWIATDLFPGVLL